MTGRIRWSEDVRGNVVGCVGTLEGRVFKIQRPVLAGERWVLTTTLPDWLDEVKVGSVTLLKSTAEAWLAEFISSLGASFKPEAAVRQAGRQSECPIEAVFPDRRIPCTYRRGHGGPHSFITGADQEAAKAAGEKEN